MARPTDYARRLDLLDAVVDHVIERGVSELSLRPLAEGVGVSPTTLVHHFGTKDELLVAVMRRVRERLLAVARAAGADATSEEVTVRAWSWSSAPEHAALFRLFFEVYGMALQQPDRFAAFLDGVVTDWVERGADRAGGARAARDEARIRATLGLAVVRGLLLDLLTTGDRARVEAALEAFLRHTVHGR